MAARNDLESKWQANERRLNEIAAMTGLGRELHAAESEALEAAQGRNRIRAGPGWSIRISPLVRCPLELRA
jgi:hypothetical protein